jgi:pimeloyl-ACP methyl ester carboxylesterase
MENLHTQWQSASINANGLTLFYESLGNLDAPAIILVAGLGCQLTMWPEQFCELMVKQGFRVIRFDNRDIGLSSEVNRHVKVSVPMAFLKSKLGQPIPSNYTLHDMADDLLGLMNALRIEAAHLVGVSMGGMISQIAAATHPKRFKSLSLIMTTTNSPKLPGPTWKVMNNMFLKKPRDASVEAFCEHVSRVFQVIGSPAYPTPEEELMTKAKNSFLRSKRSAGVMRQTNAVMATGCLESATRSIKTPTLVIHGLADPLLRPACGKRVAQLIQGAKLELIHGMGHDLPAQLMPKLSELIGGHSRNHEGR